MADDWRNKPGLLGRVKQAISGRSQPSVTGPVKEHPRNLNALQFNDSKVGQRMAGLQDHHEFAEHFRNAGMGAALHYTITGQTPPQLQKGIDKRLEQSQPKRGQAQGSKNPPDADDDWWEQHTGSRRENRRGWEDVMSGDPRREDRHPGFERPFDEEDFGTVNPKREKNPLGDVTPETDWRI